MYFYSDNSVNDFNPSHFDPSRVDSTKQCLKHFENSLTLTFISMNTTSVSEKVQVNKELTICERKIKWWMNQSNFNQSDYSQGCLRLKRLWSK